MRCAHSVFMCFVFIREQTATYIPFKAYWLHDSPTGLSYDLSYPLPTLCLCVLCYNPRDKQRLVPLTL